MFRRIILNSLIVLAMLLVSVANPNLSFAKAAAPSAQPAAPRITSVPYNCSDQSDIPVNQCQALVALYNSTNGPGWTNHGGWLANNTPCSWNGVICNNGGVMFLWLASNQLSGSIPSQLQDLTNLMELDLSSNQVSGSIPPQLGSLPNLGQLWLYSNQLSGSIPPELGNLANGGGCLCLSNNQLSGSIPPELGKLTTLRGLHLDHNHLSGQIPSGLTQMANLGDPGQGGDSSFELTLDHNWFTVPNPYPSVPPTALETFLNIKDPGWETSQIIPADQFTCSLVFEIPPSECQALFALYSGTGGATWKNKSIWLTSATPSRWFGVTVSGGHVTGLSATNNGLSGSIPTLIGNLTNLQHLYLDHNHLSGLVPSELAQLVNLADSAPPSSPNLKLENNWLTVPNPYPSNPPTTLDTFLMNKDLGWENTQGVTADILPAAGGEVKSADGHVNVTVPSGGVSQPVTLKLTSFTKPGAPTGNLSFANTSFTLTAYDTGGHPITPFNFALPVTITLHYQDSDVTGLDESKLILYYWDTTASAWKDAAKTCSPASTYLRDPAHNTLSVNVCHLTEFALMEKVTVYMYLPFIRR